MYMYKSGTILYDRKIIISGSRPFAKYAYVYINIYNIIYMHTITHYDRKIELGKVLYAYIL